MKKSFCKVLAMAVASVMMMSTAAFANTTDPAKGIQTPELSGEIATITISGLTDNEEATILVVNHGTDLADLEDDTSDIIHINQDTVKNGKVTFEVDASAAKADASGKKYVDIYSSYSSFTVSEDDPVPAFMLAKVLIGAGESDIVYGDVDENGEIGLNDALITLDIYTGIIADPTEVQLNAADVDGADGVTLNDALMILDKYTGIYTDDKFPVEK